MVVEKQFVPNTSGNVVTKLVDFHHERQPTYLFRKVSLSVLVT